MKTALRLIVSIIFIFIAGCSSAPGLKPRTVEEYYLSTGVEKYFLPEIPDWINFSEDAGCFRTKGLKYFDIDALMKSYALNYFEAIQLQALFNEDFLSAKSTQVRQALTLKEEENLFFKASERVGSKIFFTDLPAFKRIHLIWLDNIIGDKNSEGRLKNFLASETHNEGVPVLISACRTKKEIESVLPEAHYKIISAELFSVYNQQGQRIPNMHLDLSVFFKADQKLFFYTQGNKIQIDAVKGNYKILNY